MHRSWNVAPLLLTCVIAACAAQTPAHRAHADPRRPPVAGTSRLGVAAPATPIADVVLPPAATGARTAELPSRRLLRREPDLGVACATANSIACDRVGLAVWLVDAHARRVSATIDGRSLRLRPSHGHGDRPPWIGYLRPAGLLDGPLKVTPDRGPTGWQGHHARDAVVVVSVERPSGATVRTRLTVALRPGWG